MALAPIALAGYGGGFSLSPQTNTMPIAGGKWTWVGSPNVANSAGVYGTTGVASASNLPSARGGASSAPRADHLFHIITSAIVTKRPGKRSSR